MLSANRGTCRARIVVGFLRFFIIIIQVNSIPRGLIYPKPTRILFTLVKWNVGVLVHPVSQGLGVLVCTFWRVVLALQNTQVTGKEHGP